MPNAFHVPGPVLVSAGIGTTGGPPPPLVPVGFAEDGIDISIEILKEPVKADFAGGAPADYQFMGAMAKIRGRLSAYDSVVLATLRGRSMGGSATDGVLGPAGSLMATGGFTYRLALTSADEPWLFTTCDLAEASDAKLGTKYTVWNVAWRAWGFLPGASTAGAMAGNVLYSHIVV